MTILCITPDCVLGLQATLQGVDRIGVVLQQEQEQEQVAGTTSEEMEDFKTQILVLQQQVQLYIISLLF